MKLFLQLHTTLLSLPNPITTPTQFSIPAVIKQQTHTDTILMRCSCRTTFFASNKKLRSISTPPNSSKNQNSKILFNVLSHRSHEKHQFASFRIYLQQNLTCEAFLLWLRADEQSLNEGCSIASLKKKSKLGDCKFLQSSHMISGLHLCSYVYLSIQ